MLREIFKSILSRNDISLAVVTILLLFSAVYIIISVLSNTITDIVGLSHLGETILNMILAMVAGYWCGREITYTALENEESDKR